MDAPSPSKEPASVIKGDHRISGRRGEVSQVRLLFATLGAHGGAASLTRLAVYPLDRIKVLLQLSPAWLTSGPQQSGGWWRRFLGGGEALKVTKTVIRLDGTVALWRGVAPHLLGSLQGAAVRLALLQRFRPYHAANVLDDTETVELKGSNEDAPFTRRVACVFGATVCGLAAAYPLDLAFTRVAVSRREGGQWKGAVGCLSAAWQDGRVTGLYRGFSLSLLAAVPFVATTILLTDALERRVRTKVEPHPLQLRLKEVLEEEERLEADDDLSGDWEMLRSRSITTSGPDAARDSTAEPLRFFPWNFVAGITAGAAAQIVTYPLDTARRRYIFDRRPCGRASASLRSVILDTARRGWRDWYRGCGVNTLKAIPECAVLSALYFYVKTAMPP